MIQSPFEIEMFSSHANCISILSPNDDINASVFASAFVSIALQKYDFCFSERQI